MLFFEDLSDERGVFGVRIAILRTSRAPAFSLDAPSKPQASFSRSDHSISKGHILLKSPSLMD